jgi:clan AA aspartic protease
MGKVTEKIKLTSLFDTNKWIEAEAVIDTGATMLVLPQNLVDELGLRKIREATVKYANNQRQRKSVYAGLLVEIKGRVGSFDVLAEKEGTEPLVGQIVLEELDLVVEPRTRTLVPNPRSPEMPMVEIL